MRRLMTSTRPIRLLAALGLAGALAVGSTIALAAEPPNLGTAANYAVMATSEITNTGATSIQGGLGLHPGTSVSGAPVVVGSYDVDNAAADLAHDHLIVAYNAAFAALTTTNLTGSDLGTVGVLTPGVYTFDSSAQLTGNLTLDGGGATNPLFIFQMGSSLTTATSASVSLQNGAGACAVFWQVGSSATIGESTSFQGTIMADTSITMNAGATIGVGGLNHGGRALAMDGAVTMINNTIIAPTSSCESAAAPISAPTTAPTDVPSDTAATSVPAIQVFSVPGPSLSPGLPLLPDTGLADAAGMPLTAVALLALAGVATLGLVSAASASGRRRG